MGRTIIGKVGVTPKKVYDNYTNYKRLDIVTYDGCSYLCLIDCTGIVPTNEQYWQLLADKGRFTEDDKENFKDAVVDYSKTAINKQTEEKIAELDNYTTEKEKELENTKTALQEEMSGTKDILVQEILDTQNGFDNNAINKTQDFDSNAINKTEDFNQNAENKTNNYNSLTEQKKAELEELANSVTDMATSLSFAQTYVDKQMKLHIVSESELANNNFFIKDGKLGVKANVEG